MDSAARQVGADGLTVDCTAPGLDKFEIDLNLNTLSLKFDEPVQISTLDRAKLSLVTAATNAVGLLMAVESSTQPTKNSDVVLTADELKKVKLATQICKGMFKKRLLFTNVWFNKMTVIVM